MNGKLNWNGLNVSILFHKDYVMGGIYFSIPFKLENIQITNETIIVERITKSILNKINKLGWPDLNPTGEYWMMLLPSERVKNGYTHQFHYCFSSILKSTYDFYQKLISRIDV